MDFLSGVDGISASGLGADTTTPPFRIGLEAGGELVCGSGDSVPPGLARKASNAFKKSDM